MRGWVAGFILVTIAMTGCSGDPTRIEPTSTDAPVKSEFHRLVVLVTDGPAGPPIPGAFLGSPYSMGFDESAIANEQGLAAFDVTPERGIRFAAWKEGFTTEQVIDIRSGRAGEESRVEVPLYHAMVTLLLDGTLGPAGASTHRAVTAHTSWEPVAIQWGSGDDAQIGYQNRLVGINATLQWVNGPAGGGDLAVGLGQDGAVPQIVRDSNSTSEASIGERSERIDVGFEELHDLGWREGAAFFAGPAAGSVWAAPLGVGWHLELTGWFDGDLGRRPAPGLGILAIVGGLAAVAFLVRKGKR